MQANSHTHKKARVPYRRFHLGSLAIQQFDKSTWIIAFSEAVRGEHSTKFIVQYSIGEAKNEVCFPISIENGFSRCLFY